jgi:hypothetical protein
VIGYLKTLLNGLAPISTCPLKFTSVTHRAVPVEILTLWANRSTGDPKNCFTFTTLNKKDVPYSITVSPGTDLRCTLFFRQKCQYGPKSNDLNRMRSGIYPEVVENMAYPGHGDFGTAEWYASGFYSQESKGKPPKSILCTNMYKAEVGLVTE